MKLSDWFEIDDQEYMWYRLQGYEIESVEENLETRIRWTYDGKAHRTDGPAITYHDGCCRWFLNNKEYTEEEFSEATKL